MELGTTIRVPRTSSPPTTATSVKMKSYYGPSVPFSRAVKNPPAMASFRLESFVSASVSSSNSCQVTGSGTDEFTIAMISFLNSSSVSLSSNSAYLYCWDGPAAQPTALEVESCSLLHCSQTPHSFPVHSLRDN